VALVATLLPAPLSRESWRLATRLAPFVGKSYRGLYQLGPGGPGGGLVYFAASVGALVAAAELWQRHGWNRLFTVGYEAAH
jgi:hypothetical protein